MSMGKLEDEVVKSAEALVEQLSTTKVMSPTDLLKAFDTLKEKVFEMQEARQHQHPTKYGAKHQRS
jgi:hypothetical protein